MTTEMLPMVFHYGVPAVVPDRPPVWEPSPQLLEQLRIGHDFRNALVEIYHEFDRLKAEAWNTSPTFKAINERYTELSAQADELRAAGDKDALKVLNVEFKVVRAERKELRTACYGEVRKALKTASDWLRSVTDKSLYAEWSIQRGLYWATYNDIKDQLATAYKNVGQKRADGRPSQLRFKSWDGTGTIAVQLQANPNVTRDPERLTVAERDKDCPNPWRGVFGIDRWQDPSVWKQLTRRNRRAWVWIALGNGKVETIPIIIDRTMPAESEVVMARLSAHRIGPDLRWKLSVVAKVPMPEAPESGPVAAMHIGWRRLPSGDIHVATVQSSAPLKRPNDLLTYGPPQSKDPERIAAGTHVPSYGRVVLSDRAYTWHVYAPAGWGEEAERLDGVRSQRDLNLNAIKTVIARWFKERQHVIQEQYHEKFENASMWRSPRRVHSLNNLLQTIGVNIMDPFTTIDYQQVKDFQSLIAGWCEQDNHLWAWVAHATAQLVARRKHCWQNVAAWLANQCQAIVIDDIDIASLAQKTATENPFEATAARKSLIQASPGELRAAVSNACRSRNVLLVQQDSRWLTHEHVVCGKRNDNAPTEKSTLWCPTCHDYYDIEINATQKLLASVAADGGIESIRAEQATKQRGPRQRRKTTTEGEFNESR